MNASSALRNRFSLSMLVLAGLLAVAGLLLRGPFGNPTVNPSGFAQGVVASKFMIAWIIIMVGAIVRTYSLVVLYALLAPTRLHRLAFWALLLSFLDEGLFIGLTGILAFVAPVAGNAYLQGDTHMLDILKAGFFTGPALFILYPSALLGTAGSILFGIAIWRSGSLPKWAGILYLLTTPLLAYGPAVSYFLELLGGLLLMVSGAWIAAAAWRMPSMEMQSAPPMENARMTTRT